MVYVCSGTDSEKLDWFRTINIAGQKLTNQELHNAVYAGTWVSDAKRYLSRCGCPAYGMASDYMNESPIRQEYLESAIRWNCRDAIEDYMGRLHNDDSARPLWEYFQSVIRWIEQTFTMKRKSIMKGVDWGFLYDTFGDTKLGTDKIEKETAQACA